MVFDRSQVDAALERALELDAPSSATFDVGAVQRLADELGLSRASIMQAMGETLGTAPGPLNTVAQAIIPASPQEIHRALGSYFRLRGLTTAGSMVWQQDAGWWPDLYRFTATTPVAVAAASTDDGTIVRLTARLDRVWRAHLVAAILAPLALAIALVAGPGPSVLAAAGLALLWAGAVAWGYLLRREAIRRRLEGALADVSSPAYRLQPW